MSEPINTIVNIIILLVVAAFVPTITLVGYHYYKTKSVKRLNIILVLLLLGLELVRFFYNAASYPEAKVPSGSLTFTFVTFAVVISLFAVFAENRVGHFFRKLNVLTALVPVILAASLTHITNLPNDDFTVMKALYMVEAGLYITLAVSFVVLSGFKFKPLDILWCGLSVVAYIGINAATIHFFETPIPYDLQYYLTMAGVLLSVPLSFALYIPVSKVYRSKLDSVKSDA